jgi:hypothetical protein
MGSSSRQPREKNGAAEKTVRQWERLYPDSWILLEITAQVNDEPVRGKLIATARDPKQFHREWKRQRELGVRTMLTFGDPIQPRPAVVASAT